VAPSSAPTSGPIAAQVSGPSAEPVLTDLAPDLALSSSGPGGPVTPALVDRYRSDVGPRVPLSAGQTLSQVLDTSPSVRQVLSHSRNLVQLQVLDQD
jgi:hypothetical protein